MPQIIFDAEWMVEAGLSEKTGLSERQIKSYRLNLWIEGVHFKHLTALGETDNAKEGANKQVISSQADSLIKISRIWADFFPANTSNQPI
ncbi:hypothetical protein AF35_00226 [Enterobacter roggenkampii CHS 79]|nr:excisionase family protein [Enterobacter roggenkampii]KDF60106.1 hypothetical protein AF35_00226 [Enterobacter roggenkampii CHS 79]